jgi:Flp pilus assembly protein TadG
MTQFEPGTGQKSVRRPRAFRLRGAEPLEFTLVLLPLLAMVTVLLDTSWAVFAKATLQRAVRIGVRGGTGGSGPAAGSTSAVTDVSTSSTGDQSGNIMRVSVRNCSLVPLPPAIFNWKTAADNNRDMS